MKAHMGSETDGGRPAVVAQAPSATVPAPEAAGAKMTPEQIAIKKRQLEEERARLLALKVRPLK